MLYSYSIIPTSTAASAKFSYHFLLETLGSPSFFPSFLLTGIVLEAQGGAREPLPPWVYCTGTAEGSAFFDEQISSSQHNKSSTAILGSRLKSELDYYFWYDTSRVMRCSHGAE